jgi:hypothetical protein
LGPVERRIGRSMCAVTGRIPAIAAIRGRVGYCR